MSERRENHRIFHVNFYLVNILMENIPISLSLCPCLVDTPDPYVELRIRSAPNGKRRTVTIDNEPNPVWDETFVFLLDQSLKNILRE